MKILKTILSVFAVIAVFSTGALAQESQNLNVSADVVAELTLTKNNDIDFGTIPAEGDPVLDPQGTSTADVGTIGGTGSTATFGKLTVSGESGGDIVITYDASATLTGPSGSDDITFTADVAGNTTDDIGSSTDLTSGNTYSLSNPGSGNGAYYIYVGGNLGSLSGQASGAYSTSTPMSVQVQYL